MFEGPEFAGAAEAGLDFVEDEDDVVFFAPIGELANVFYGREIGANALVGFEHDSGDVLRLQSFLFQGRQKQMEARVFGPVAVRERDLHDGGIFIDDPAFLAGNATRLLRAESAAVKTAFSADDAD